MFTIMLKKLIEKVPRIVETNVATSENVGEKFHHNKKL